MKLLNYDERTLILNNVCSVAREIPPTFSRTQYNILCRLIKQKPISEQFFNFLLLKLYGLQDWKKLNYEQMYELIHVLTYYNYPQSQ